MSKLKIVFLIIYNIFLMNGGLALLLTKYRILTELPLFIFLIIQYRHKIKKNIIVALEDGFAVVHVEVD